MKAGIHPKYVPVTITCMGCGAKIQTRSTKGRDFSVDVCSNCHPFYTGRQKFVDSAGRVERFQKKWGATSVGSKPPAKKAAKPEKAAKPADAPVAEPKTAKPEAKAEAKPEAKPEAKA